MLDPLKKWTPAAPKSWLFWTAGLMWSGVGIYLCSLTLTWLTPISNGAKIWLVSGSVLLAASIYIFGFSRFAEKNIQRILSYTKEKICIFAFQQWSSYPLVIFMISLGVFLRQNSPIPKPILAVLYIGIGGSLFLASLHYYKTIWTMQ